MRLLQLMAGASHGGAETFFVDLALALGRAGVVQHIVTRPAADRVARLTAAGLAVTPARFGGWWDWPTRRRIART
ncbi:MAG: hypothetical protein KDE14_02255, partial [Rhodobacteraceae bacterium]|nr:hypothetical protein [Paracoccaceae bacterium]